MTPLFAGCFTREDGHPRKPDPAAFDAAMRTCGLRQGDTLTVGDREIDIQAGRAAGIRTCLFRGGNARTEADLAVREFSELQEYLRRMNAR